MFARSFFNNPQKHRLKTFLALFGLIVASLATIIFLKNPKMAEAGWPPTAQEWFKRKQLTLVNNSGQTLSANTTYSLTVNTKELYDNGDIQADCQDLRVYYQPDSNTAAKLNYYVEVPAGLTCATSEATTLHFPLQADLTNGSQSGNYYLYFKNPTAQSESSIAAFDIGDKKATFYCGFRGGTDCVNQEGMVEPTTESGAIRYGGEKSALSFDGYNDLINLGSPSSLDNIIIDYGKITIESWLYLDNKGGCHQYWTSTTFGGDANKGGWWAYWGCGNPNGNFQIRCTETNASSTPSATLPLKEWFHYAITFDNTTDRKVRIFLNGEEVSYSVQNACVGDIKDDSSTNKMVWGNEWGGGSARKGFLDEFRISNTIRYTENFTPQTTPFVRDEFTKLLLHFDENGDDPRNTGKAIDDSGNGNHGAITGAKYVTGIVGIDSSTQETGALPTQSYASHQGVFLEEATTNLIPNPSFEHSTYNTGWSIGAGATASENTTAPYYKFGAKSLKLVASADANATTSINTGSTAVHTLSAYVYNGTSGAIGGTVDSTVAQLIYNGVVVGTTYTDMGGGWWRLNYSAAAGSGEQDYGIQVKSGKTIYVDGVQLEQKAYVTTYVDGSLGDGYDWNGTENESTSGRAITDLRFATFTNIDNRYGTISFWTKKYNWHRSLQPSWSGSLFISEDTGSSFYFSVHQGVGLHFRYTNTGNYISYNSDSFDKNKWYHLAISWHGNGSEINEYRMYVNGTQVASITGVNETLNTISELRIGYLLDGLMSDLRIFDQSLSFSEISSLYYSGLGSHQIQTGYTEQYTDGEPPTSMWHLDEGSGSTIYDSIGSYHGALGTGDSAPVWADGAYCISNSCLSFDGTNDYALIDSTITGLKSLSFWIKPAATSTSVIDLNGNQTVTINNNTVLANNFSSPSIYVNGQATTSLNTNEWSHILITSSTSFAASNLKLGQVGGNFFSGYIDEIKVFPYVLSADQVKKELNLGKAVSFGEKPETAQVTPISSKLVAYWKFDEGYGETAHNSVAAGADATILGADWNVDGKTGKALYFNGTASDYAYATQSDGVLNSASNSFTLSAWVKLENDSGGLDYIIGKKGFHGGLLTDGSSRIKFTIVNGSNVYYHANFDNPSLNRWYHVVGVFDRTDNSMKLYIDGNLKDTNTLEGNIRGYDNKWRMGGEGNTSWNFKGFIDEVKIYNVALTPEEVLQDYNQGMAAVMGQSSANTASGASGGSAAQEYCVPGSTDYCAPPVAEWNFEENTGTTARDTSGNGNDGTWYGSSTRHYAPGKYGSAGVFNGSDDYVDINNAFGQPNIITISIWFKTSSNGIIFGQHNNVQPPTSPTSWIPVFWVIPDGRLRAELWTGVISAIYTSGSVADNKWHQAVMVGNNTSQYLYLDGALVGSRGGTITQNWWARTTIGTGFASNRESYGAVWKYFPGLIDQVRIYNYARTPAQIAWDYNRGGPVGHWRFDECEGTVAHDVSGNENHGTINIGATAPQTSVGTCTSGNSAHAWYNGRNGKYNSSLNFDGVDDWVDCGSGSDFNSSTLTYSFWYKSSFGSIQCLATKYKDDNNKLQICSNYVGVKEGSWKQQISLPGGAFDGSWHHLTVVAGTSGVYVYYDGVLTGSDGTSSDLSFLDDSVVEIGRMTAGYPFNGQIDDVRIYNYALTPLQIKTLYNDGAVRFGE